MPLHPNSFINQIIPDEGVWNYLNEEGIIMTKQILGAITLALGCYTATASASPKEYLVKLAPGAANNLSIMSNLAQLAGKSELVANDWVKVTDTKGTLSPKTLLQENAAVEYVQPNYRVKLLEDYRIKDGILLQKLAQLAGDQPGADKKKDNPAIPPAPQPSQGADPLYSKQWGMIDNHVKEAWQLATYSPLMAPAPMVVAVIDTGVDYTHEDLLANMWRNPGETGVDAQGRNKDSNGVDDDNNGYVDDVVGWDFASNDNKPYDLAVEPLQLLAGGGNPGHGTHCAGNVAAVANNGKGVVGVAPNVKIMALRFLTEKGGGTTADAIKAIKYAVDNGALVTSNSWGSEGEDPQDDTENKALKDMIQYAQDKGTLFIAAAGNGHQGAGYDNDTDAKPGYPASYDHDTIVSVAAIDNSNQLGSFSNWGARTVDLGAPGVKVFSTTVGSKYSDTVIDIMGFTAYWDGTSMATPHVSGAAALYWSAHPEKDWRQVKAALLGSVKQIPALQGKTTTGGKLDTLNLMHQ
jgi:subtilisin family serine protease